MASVLDAPFPDHPPAPRERCNSAIALGQQVSSGVELGATPEAPSSAEANEAIEAIRNAGQGVVVLGLAPDDSVAVLAESLESTLWAAAAEALSDDMLAWVYGMVGIGDSEMKKLVLLTWVGCVLPPRDRGRVSELQGLIRAELPRLVVHLEVFAFSAAEASEAEILDRLKALDRGFGGAPSGTVEVNSVAVEKRGHAAPRLELQR
jgi:hypothetical protein